MARDKAEALARRQTGMNPRTFWSAMKARGLTFFSGVPDSTLQPLYETMLQDASIRYVPAVREDVALGIASAAYFTGRLGGAMMQNSGLGNIVNTLSSFSLIYRVPSLLIIGWRGYGGPPNDAPEHWFMGPKTTDFLDLLEIPYEILGGDDLDGGLDRLLDAMARDSIPGAVLVRAGIFR